MTLLPRMVLKMVNHNSTADSTATPGVLVQKINHGSGTVPWSRTKEKLFWQDIECRWQPNRTTLGYFIEAPVSEIPESSDSNAKLCHFGEGKLRSTDTYCTVMKWRPHMKNKGI